MTKTHAYLEVRIGPMGRKLTFRRDPNRHWPNGEIRIGDYDHNNDREIAWIDAIEAQMIVDALLTLLGKEDRTQ